MLGWDPASWGWWSWTLHGLGLLYVVGFVWAWERFRRAERRARDAKPGAEVAYNGKIGGFPWAFYAKMMGRRRFEAQDARDERNTR